MKKEYRSVTKTKKRIRAAFVELLGEKKHIESIAVTELAARADIAKSTFYNHYSDVYAVAEEFENELTDQFSAAFEKMSHQSETEYEGTIRKLIEFLKENEDIYRRAMLSSDVKFFIEKLKSVIAKNAFENSVSLPFSTNKSKRYVQIRFLTNACVDTMVDYFRGAFAMSLDDVGTIIINFLKKMK